MEEGKGGMESGREGKGERERERERVGKREEGLDLYALFIELMNRSIPIQALSVLENWFSLCLSCVEWGSVMSYFYELKLV